MVTVQAIVTGKVQGVGFRYTSQHFASILQLKGSVRNLTGGQVELIIQGSKENVDQMLSMLHERFKIHRIELQELAAPDTFSDFKITF